MIQKNKEIEISKEDIFANDKLDRESTIIDLSQLLISTNEPFVLSINASWGAGKTTFVKLWKAYLENDLDIHSIYFSAWEDDFSKEPLIAIMGELNAYIENHFPKDKNLHKQFDELKSVSGKIIKRGLPAFIKGVTAGALDLDKGVESAIGAVTESVAKELIDSYEHDKKITIKFKELLHKIIEHIDSDKPLIIFIDELDRCRPIYAIELLERLKHIFGIEKLIFVLSVDKKQLSESIKSQYGNIDAENYLRRFIDLEFSLPYYDNEKFSMHLTDIFQLKEILLTKHIASNGLEFSKYLILLLKVYNLTPREIEQLFIKLNIVFKTLPSDMFPIHIPIIVFLEVSRVSKTNISIVEKQLLDNKNVFQDVKGYLFLSLSILKCILVNNEQEYEELKRVLENAENEESLDVEVLKNNFSYLEDVLEAKWDFTHFKSIFISEEHYPNNLYKATLNAKKSIEFVARFNI